jgi:hypothetical protein
MSSKAKVWVLSGLVATLAAAVIWKIIDRRVDPAKRPAAVASARLPIPQGSEKPSAGIKGISVATHSASTARGSKTVTAPPAAEQQSGPDEYAASPAAPGRQTGGEGGDTANSTSRESIQTQPFPSREPLPGEVIIQNAEAALARGNLISPPDDNALYWARRAQRINPQNQPAIQIEEAILLGSIQVIQADQKAGRYDSALKRLTIMQTLYPNRRELSRLRSAIQQEQSRRQQYVTR